MTQRELYETIKDEFYKAILALRNGELIVCENTKPVCETADRLYQLSGSELDYDGSFFLEPEEVADYAKQFKHFAETLNEAVSTLTLFLIDTGFAEIEGGEI